MGGESFRKKMADRTKGFLDHREGEALFGAARAVAAGGSFVEIGGYCGKSAIYLGAAAAETGRLLFSIDHHRGSEELQPGWAHHDPETWDAAAQAIDTLPFFRRTIREAGLEDHVVAMVGRSKDVAHWWPGAPAFLFIDGGHGAEEAWGDYRAWASKVAPGGVLAIHDVFPNPADGGRPPYEIWSAAKASGLFEEIALVKSLGLLRRVV